MASGTQRSVYIRFIGFDYAQLNSLLFSFASFAPLREKNLTQRRETRKEFMSKSQIPNPKSQIAVCLVSGGMDSCVTAAIAKSENKEIAFLHVSYGQRTERRERKAFNDIADFYAVEKRLDVSIEYLTKIGGSVLTDKTSK